MLSVQGNGSGFSELFRKADEARNRDTDATLTSILRAVRTHLGMAVAFISEFDNNQRTFRYIDQSKGVEILNVGDSDPLEESYCQRVVDGRLPELIKDAQELSEARALPVTEALDIGAHISTPLRLSDGTVYGTFCFFSFHADHSLNERDADVVRAFAKIAAELLEPHVSVQRAEERDRRLIEDLIQQDGFSMIW